MTSESALLDLLRCELDATNHQFTHILALKQWGFDAAAARITEVDDIDFVNAMRIVDHLVSSGTPFSLGRPEFEPGNDYAAILRAEQTSEARLLDALNHAQGLDTAMQTFIDTARAPRAAYAQWLQQQIATPESGASEKPDTVDGTRDLVAHLITLIEQALVHAYVEWHNDNTAAADAAWLSSGAAMMHLTRLVNLSAKLATLPAAGTCPQASFQHQPGDTLEADQALAYQCALAARKAADSCEHSSIARYCDTIDRSYRAFVAWDGRQPHPDLDTTPTVFHSFQKTLRKFGL